MSTIHAEHDADENGLDLPTTEAAAPLGDPASTLEQARAALQAGEISTPEFIERVAPLLERIQPSPADETTPAPGLATLAGSLAPIVRAGSGLSVVGLGLGVLALAGGAFALGVLARPAATR